MNWLAHIFLSEQSIEFQIGNYLADPLKGRVWHGASDDLQKGMQVHKIIDTYTDAHPIFKQSKNRLAQKGLLKSVVIDLTYDYLLTKNWDCYCHISKERYLHTFYEQAYQVLPSLPTHASTSLKRMIDFDLLNKYQNLEQLYQAFQRVDKRLSPRLRQRDLATNYYEIVCDNITDIEKDFLLFFPQLANKVKENTSLEKLEHWKI